MKKIILLLLLAGMANAQIVNIPDANFKSALINSGTAAGIAYNSAFAHIEVDTNHDGEIEAGEAEIVSVLDAQTLGITSFEGIQSFTGLTWFRSIDHVLSSIDLSANINLTQLQILDAQLPSIDVTMLTNLEVLSVYNSQLTTLNVTPLTQLKNLSCQLNQLTELDVSTLTQLEYLDVNSNQLTQIDITGLNQLISAVLRYNNISSVDFSNSHALKYVYLGPNNISAVDISALPNLEIFDVPQCHLTTLDCRANTHLTFLACSDNNLQTLYIKNGSNETPISSNIMDISSGNPLEYICADDFQVADIQAQLITAENTTTLVGSYCSFAPGGNYNTITGTAQFDMDANGCGSGDAFPLNLAIRIDDGMLEGSSAVNASGNYAFYTAAGNFTLMPQLENPSYFTVSPLSAAVSFPVLDNSVSNTNFCITSNGIHPDLEIIISPLSIPRPGDNIAYNIVYRNKGTETLSGAISMLYDSAQMEFVSSTIIPDNSLPGLLSYTFSSLAPFSAQNFQVTLNINTPVETPPVNLGDTISMSASITAVPADEETPEDNISTVNQTVVGSFDPNNKICTEGDYAPPTAIGKYLHYTVNFENVGTAEAQNIVVRDEIDTTKYDISTLQVIESSHPVYVKVTGNVAEFIFENINLGGRALEPIGGHGNVLFKLKTISSLNVGDTAANTANVYFDYNAPISTNDARTTFAQLSAQQFATDESISVYPNPATDRITIKANEKITSVSLFDVQGRLLKTIMPDKNATSIDISEQNSGIYFVKAETTKGSSVIKIIKQ